MELKPFQVVMLCAVAFAGVVAIDLIVKLRGNEEFKTSLSNLDLSTLRPRLVSEEGLPEMPNFDDVVEPEVPTEDE
jgi:hypothetical protein